MGYLPTELVCLELPIKSLLSISLVRILNGTILGVKIGGGGPTSWELQTLYTGCYQLDQPISLLAHHLSIGRFQLSVDPYVGGHV